MTPNRLGRILPGLVLAALAFIHQPASGLVQPQSPQTVTIPGRILVGDDGSLPQIGAGMDARGPTLPLRLSLDAGARDMRFPFERDGTFLAILPAGRYSISLGVGIADHERIVAFTYGKTDVLNSPVTIRPDDPHELVLRLKPPPGVPAKVSGRVSNIADLDVRAAGLPLVFARRSMDVFARGGSMESEAFPSVTDLRADGTFEFPKLFPGPYSVQIPNVTSPLSIEVAGRDIANVVLNPLPARPANAPVVPIKWRINVEGGYPAPQFELTLTGASTIPQRPVSSPPETGGTYRTYAQRGEYRLRIGALPPGYQLKSIVSGSTDLLTEPLIVSGPEPANVVMNVAVSQPEDWVTLSGRVRGLANLPVSPSGAVLEIVEQGSATMRIQTTSVRPDGTFESRKVLPGAYRLLLHARDADGSFPAVLIQSISVTKQNNTDIDLSIPENTTIRGRVIVDGNAPRPCLSLSVDRNTRNFRAQCQPDGGFSASVPVGDYRIQAWGFPTGYYWIKSFTFGDIDLLQQNIRLPAASPTEMIVTLGTIESAPTGSVRGRVVPPPSRTGDSSVLAVWRDGGRFETSIRPDGSFDFPRLLVGTYSPQVGPLTSNSPLTTFVVLEGRTTEIEVRP